ncbi:MAG: hypothetical protein JW731_11635 [Bacteroidales bacterium]|nr:hypothetical protein [Bacteroidales bacterium]
MDSLFRERNEKFNDYLIFRNTMGQRTWENLVNLNSKAHEVLKLDKEIITILKKEIGELQILKSEYEQLQLQILALKKEAEIQRTITEDKKYMINILLIVIAGLGILLLIMLVLFIDRQTRYRTARLELERLWHMGVHPENDHESEDMIKYKLLNENLEKEIEKLKNQNQEIKKHLLDTEEKLHRETESKNKIESEIRSMIEDIKRAGQK